MTDLFARLIRSLSVVWLLFAVSALSATTWGYDAQTDNASFGYDELSRSATDYDGASVLVGNGRKTRANADYAPFSKFAKSLAAEETVSLLPARSPWPANSGFIEGTVQTKFLMPGELFDRYGFGGGRFVSPAGTPIDARALRPGTENLPFNTYQVVKPFEVSAGGIQPWFGQPGLGHNTNCQSL